MAVLVAFSSLESTSFSESSREYSSISNSGISLMAYPDFTDFIPGFSSGSNGLYERILSLNVIFSIK